ncbi:VWA domain-containing protein [Capnocytophaga canimorsus]|uniref:VWA domain-containing protein n=1 Tax=Capnocytophaga canimorsus TaxID=28188 RepID=UPI001EDD6B53|nr:VWA domain-containing protein [Capnocytophaga canimorsus]MDT9500495.1 VWA domain-containing protein [Capnocytophaga canimorsus]GJQ04106.1 BatB protein [Capnocytophaga canimorsus]
MIHIEEKIYLLFCLTILPLALFFVIFRIIKNKKQRQFTNERLFKRLAPNRSTFKPWLKFGLLSLMLLLLGIALSNPKIGTKMETVKREGVDVVFAIDVSKSMLAQDVSPNRLEKAKRLVSETLNQLKGDRIGIVAYAASAYPQLPLTTDYSAARMFLQSLNTDMLSSQGTAIQEAIQMASSYFSDANPTARILILISDGEDHEMGASEIAYEAANQGIRIYSIGVGTEKGSTIPIDNGGNISYKRDKNGEVVITKLNSGLLSEIARNANGSYIDGDNTSKAVEEIVSLLDGIEKSEFETQQYVDYADQFQWFLFAVIVILLIDLLIFERKTAWVKKINLFNEKSE